MQLILAIDSDPRRSEQLAALVRARLEHVDLVQATSAGEGLHALRDRVPDLILTSPLLSPFDDGVLDEYLRELGAAATHVQTLRIPMLSSGPRKKSAANRLFSLGRKKPQTSPAAPEGCDPKVFADEIAHYLSRSLEERSAARTMQETPAAAKGDDFSEMAPQADTDAPGDSFPGSIFDLRQAAPARRVDEEMSFVRDEALHAVAEPEPPMHSERPLPVYLEPEPIVEPESVSYVLPERVAPIDPEPVTFVTPEPVAFITPEPVAFVEPQPIAFAEPEPVRLVEPERVISIEPEPVARVEPEPPSIVRPDAIAHKAPEPVTLTPPPVKPAVAAPAFVSPAAAPKPAAPATGSGNSASFEAALAAIRAAWGKPEDRKPSAAAKPAAPAVPATPTAPSGEVDLTNAVAPAAGTTRPEKPRKARGGSNQDDWAVLDPNRYEFSALLNKLDEVTDPDETPTGVTNRR